MRVNTQMDLMSVFDEEEIKKRTEGLDIEFIPIERSIDTEYEDLIKNLAIKDHYARRAARPKFLRKSALIMMIDGEFSGFGIFETDNRRSEERRVGKGRKPERSGRS